MTSITSIPSQVLSGERSGPRFPEIPQSKFIESTGKTIV